MFTCANDPDDGVNGGATTELLARERGASALLALVAAVAVAKPADDVRRRKLRLGGNGGAFAPAAPPSVPNKLATLDDAAAAADAPLGAMSHSENDDDTASW